MRTWYIECWHSGDVEEGHYYRVDAADAVDAARRLIDHLRSAGGGCYTATYLRIEATPTAPRTRPETAI